MKKSDLFKAIAQIATTVVLPQVKGAGLVVKGVEALVHRNDDPDDDLDEVSSAIVNILLGGTAATEALTGQDIVNDPVLAQIAANIKGDIALFQHLLVERHGAKVQPAA